MITRSGDISLHIKFIGSDSSPLILLELYLKLVSLLLPLYLGLGLLLLPPILLIKFEKEENQRLTRERLLLLVGVSSYALLCELKFLSPKSFVVDSMLQQDYAVESGGKIKACEKSFFMLLLRWGEFIEGESPFVFVRDLYFYIVRGSKRS